MIGNRAFLAVCIFSVAPESGTGDLSPCFPHVSVEVDPFVETIVIGTLPLLGWLNPSDETNCRWRISNVRTIAEWLDKSRSRHPQNQVLRTVAREPLTGARKRCPTGHPIATSQSFKRHNMPPSDEQPRRVLCIACSARALNILDRVLRYSQLRILTAATREKGVAICVAETIALAVLDVDSIRGEEGSVAKSLKAVRPALPIILLEERSRQSEVPASVDCVVPLNNPEKLLKCIQDLLKAGGAESVSAAS